MKFKHEKNALTNISPSSNYIWSGFLSDLLWLRAGVSTHSLGPHVCIHWVAIAKGYLDLDINFTSDQLKQFSFLFFCSLSRFLSLSLSLSLHLTFPSQALQEFASLCQREPQESVISVLTRWTIMYNKLSMVCSGGYSNS